MSSETIALLGLAGSLLAVTLASTWRFSGLAAKLLAAVQKLEEKEKEQDTRLARLDQIPVIVSELEHVKKNHSLVPKLMGEVEVLKTKVQHSAEMRRVQMRSRPDPEEADE